MAMCGPNAMWRAGEAGSSSHSLRKRVIYFVIPLLLLGLPSAHSIIPKVYLDVTDLSLLLDQTFLFQMTQVGHVNTSLTVAMNVQHNDIVQFVPSSIVIPASDSPSNASRTTYDLCALGKSPGHSEVTFNVTPPGYINMDNVFLRVTVMHSQIINIISYIMGWIYFAAWSVSFYPQIYTNFKRKSVVGLNFDFLSYNVLGFSMYSMFNCGMYFSNQIQTEYLSRHPRGLIPVQLNDVFFSLHASFATLVTIYQCYMYERGQQRVSLIGRCLLVAMILVAATAGVLASVRHITWLDFLTYCSYIKLFITLIKYLPQAYMNYKRKSTEGWSIGNIFLDLVGGSLSVLQMLLNAYNFSDWDSIIGDATKLGLGLFSLFFDLFFIMQHYWLYREGKLCENVETIEEVSDLMKSGVGSELFLIGTPEKRSITWMYQHDEEQQS